MWKLAVTIAFYSLGLKQIKKIALYFSLGLITRVFVVLVCIDLLHETSPHYQVRQASHFRKVLFQRFIIKETRKLKSSKLPVLFKTKSSFPSLNTWLPLDYKSSEGFVWIGFWFFFWCKITTGKSCMFQLLVIYSQQKHRSSSRGNPSCSQENI